jgi:tRNA(Ile2) C34 agmatinyltransferase TiaS
MTQTKTMKWIESARADLGVNKIINRPHDYVTYQRFCSHCKRRTEAFVKNEFRCRNCFRDKPKMIEIEKEFQKFFDNNIEKMFQTLRKFP